MDNASHRYVLCYITKFNSGAASCGKGKEKRVAAQFIVLIADYYFIYFSSGLPFLLEFFNTIFFFLLRGLHILSSLALTLGMGGLCYPRPPLDRGIRVLKTPRRSRRMYCRAALRPFGAVAWIGGGWSSVNDITRAGFSEMELGVEPGVPVTHWR